MQPRTLLDSTYACDAGLMGFDGPCDPAEDGDGLIVTRLADGWVRLNGPDGEIMLSPTMARVLGRTLREDA